MEIKNVLDSTEARSVIASSLGVSQQAITNWKQRGIPTDKCPKIERALGGKYSVEDMRPDVQWHRIKDKTWPHPKGRPFLEDASKEAV